MALLKVVTYPNPVLSKKAAPVTGSLTQGDLKLVRDMIDTMYQEDGVGLAAPQIGVLRQIIVVSPTATRGEEKVYLNPGIISSSSEQELDTEGCLSLPNVSCEVRRPKRIKFQAMDINGNKINQELDGFSARVIQHEVDHLNGILIIDKVDFNQRQTLLGTYRRL